MTAYLRGSFVTKGGKEKMVMEDNDNTPQKQENKLDETTRKCAAKYDAFAQSNSGGLILGFLKFEKNIVPYTLQIMFVLNVLIFWAIGIAGIFGVGPLGDFPFFMRLLAGLVLVVVGPFVLHYLLEVMKYVFFAIAVPLWDKLVIRYLVNLLPEFFPFMLERTMKFIDISLDGFVVVIMAVAGVLKGVVWLPRALCQRLEKWCDKSAS